MTIATLAVITASALAGSVAGTIGSAANGNDLAPLVQGGGTATIAGVLFYVLKLVATGQFVRADTDARERRLAELAAEAQGREKANGMMLDRFERLLTGNTEAMSRLVGAVERMERDR